MNAVSLFMNLVILLAGVLGVIECIVGYLAGWPVEPTWLWGAAVYALVLDYSAKRLVTELKAP